MVSSWVGGQRVVVTSIIRKVPIYSICCVFIMDASGVLSMLLVCYSFPNEIFLLLLHNVNDTVYQIVNAPCISKVIFTSF